MKGWNGHEPPPEPDPAGDPTSPEDEAAGHERRFGATFIVVAWILVMALLAVPFWDLIEDKVNPNRGVTGSSLADGANEVTLLRNRYGHYVAPGTINGRPVSFMLDTGATVVSIPATLADDIGLERGRRISLETANGIGTGYMTRLDWVKLGTIGLENVPAVINLGHATDEVLLGMSFLKQLEFTQRGRELTLRQSARASR